MATLQHADEYGQHADHLGLEIKNNIEHDDGVFAAVSRQTMSGTTRGCKHAGVLPRCWLSP
ncbi:MAG: hypothetical protein ACREL5_00335 [Gemmatimonadales bacterium]